jgi:hypothetical protein
MGWMDQLSKALMTGEPLRLNPVDWMDGRHIRPACLPARDLRRALVYPPTNVDPVGLTIEGAQITGELNLDQATIPFPVTFSACKFAKPVSAVDARLRSLDFDRSHLCGLNLSHATVDGNLGMEGSTLHANSDGVALSLVFTKIAGGWVATDGFSAQGSIHAHGLSVACFLVMNGTISSLAESIALNLTQASLSGGWVSAGLHTKGEVAARGITVDGPLRLDGSSFQNPGGVALNVEQATLNGGFFCDERVLC